MLVKKAPKISNLVSHYKVWEVGNTQGLAPVLEKQAIYGQNYKCYLKQQFPKTSNKSE